MATINDLLQQINSSYPNTIDEMVCKNTGAVDSVTFKAGVDQPTQTSVLAIIAGFNWNAPPPDYNGFMSDVLANPAAVQFPYAVLAAQMLKNETNYVNRKNLAGLLNTWLTSLYPADVANISNFLVTTANNRHMPIT